MMMSGSGSSGGVGGAAGGGTGGAAAAAAANAAAAAAAAAARSGGNAFASGAGGGAAAAAAAEQVEGVLRLPELRYDPSSLTVLCNYLDEQVLRNTYDADACTAVLQLYILYPQCFSAEVARKIVLKGIMQLPAEDCALYIGMLQQQEKKKDWQPVQEVLHLYDLLQNCRFKQVWEYLRESCMHDVAGVPGLAESLRRYICEVVGAAYHAISVSEMNVLLGLPGNFHELDKLIVKNGWQLEEQHASPQTKEALRVIRIAAPPARDDGAAAAAAAAAAGSSSQSGAAGGALAPAAAAAAAAVGGGAAGTAAAAGGAGGSSSSGGAGGTAAAAAASLATRKTVDKYFAPDNLRACMALLMR